MNRMCRLGEAEELLSEMDFSDVADDIAETEEDRIYNENHDKIYFNLGWDGIKYIIRSSTQR